MSAAPTPAILSIQSHVAYGHVGNSAAVFPLQRMGYETWPVHTVMFSNHTGYPSFRGPVLAPADVRAVVGGLRALNVLDRCVGVVSGYMGLREIGEIVLEAVDAARAANPDALYCCDPVMGDAAPGLYVREDIPAFMRDVAAPRADIICPNPFELELLTGMPVESLDHALAAARAMLDRGPKLVLLTSLSRDEAPRDRIEMLLVGRDGAWLVSTPRLPVTGFISGSGDATAAMFLGNYARARDPKDALERTATAIYAIFEATAAAEAAELQLIAAQDALAVSDRPPRFVAAPVG